MERGLRLLALRYVHQNSGHPDRPSPASYIHAALGGDPANLSVATVDSAFDLEAAVLGALSMCGFDRLAVFLHDVIEKQTVLHDGSRLFVSEYLVVS